MTPHDLIAAFEAVAEAPDGTMRLRELILQLAVRGKLVEQDPEDEPGSELLERIAREHSRRVGTGKRARSRTNSPATCEYSPFAIPGSWSWTHLGAITHDLGQTVPARSFSYIDVGAIDNARGAIVEPLAIIDPADAPSRARKLVQPGTVIYSTVRPYLQNIAVVERAYSPMPIASTAFAVLHPHEGVDARLLFYWLRSPFFTSVVAQQMKGIAYPAINDASLLNAAVPLPPVAEQHRIVARVDELMRLLDRLDAAQSLRATTRAAARDSTLASLRQASTPEEIDVAWNRLAERLDELLVDPVDIVPLRHTVLQLAVRGRLVPQDPADEPANLLLERIAAERSRLVRTGAGRRRSTSPLAAEPVALPTLPSGWSWSTAQALTEPGCDITYGILKPVWVDSGVPTVRVTEMKSGEIDVSTLRRCDPKREAKFSKTRLTDGDLLVSKDGTIGKTAFVPAVLAGGNITQHVLRFSVSHLLNRRFVRVAVDSPMCQDWMTGETKGVALQGVNVNDFRRMPVPVPPLAEQHRIVARVDELMGLLDRLEQRLAAAERTRAAFARAAVHDLDV
ncbi:MAG TPA: restriction endonuclease subunit S [Polyangiaceae bacterium]|nr:restriction endonuclease subunit S [Polyangiaceae bacterium]